MNFLSNFLGRNVLMVSNDLIAPEFYNITEELEKFSQDSDRQAIRWLNTQQERRTVSYVELVQK